MSDYTHTTVKVGESIQGKDITIDIHKFNSNSTGNSVYIQAGIHAAEFQGNAVINLLIKEFKEHLPNGKVTLVPFVNSIAADNKSGEYNQGRFDAISGENWNRAYYCNYNWIDIFAKDHKNSSTQEITCKFRAKLIDEVHERILNVSRANALAYKLQSIALDHNIILDLHTGSNACEYLYAPSSMKLHCEHLFQKAIILIPPSEFAGALDEAITAPWAMLSDALKNYGITYKSPAAGFTVELKSHETLDIDLAKVQTARILSYLRYIGIITGDRYRHHEKVERTYCKLENTFDLYSKYGGVYSWHVNPGDKVARDKTIATCLQSSPNRTIDIKSPVDGIIVNITRSAGVPSGSHLGMFIKF